MQLKTHKTGLHKISSLASARARARTKSARTLVKWQIKSFYEGNWRWIKPDESIQQSRESWEAGIAYQRLSFN